MHAEAARDPILSTQRIRKVKISMVGIDKVKVRFPSLALAHVSHFFSEREPWALKQSTHFSIFERFEIIQLPDLFVSLAPPSPSVKRFDAFSKFFPLICSFLLYVQGGSSLVNADMQIHAVQSRTAKHTRPRPPAFTGSKCLSFGAPTHIFQLSQRAIDFRAGSQGGSDDRTAAGAPRSARAGRPDAGARGPQ